jgi:hypothetical protein
MCRAVAAAAAAAQFEEYENDPVKLAALEAEREDLDRDIQDLMAQLEAGSKTAAASSSSLGEGWALPPLTASVSGLTALAVEDLTASVSSWVGSWVPASRSWVGSLWS